jgi:hypothetical protein
VNTGVEVLCVARKMDPPNSLSTHNSKRPTITRTNFWGKVPRVVLRAPERGTSDLRSDVCHLWLKSSFKRGGWLETKWPSDPVILKV